VRSPARIPTASRGKRRGLTIDLGFAHTVLPSGGRSVRRRAGSPVHRQLLAGVARSTPPCSWSRPPTAGCPIAGAPPDPRPRGPATGWCRHQAGLVAATPWIWRCWGRGHDADGARRRNRRALRLGDGLASATCGPRRRRAHVRTPSPADGGCGSGSTGSSPRPGGHVVTGTQIGGSLTAATRSPRARGDRGPSCGGWRRTAGHARGRPGLGSRSASPAWDHRAIHRGDASSRPGRGSSPTSSTSGCSRRPGALPRRGGPPPSRLGRAPGPVAGAACRPGGPGGTGATGAAARRHARIPWRSPAARARRPDGVPTPAQATIGGARCSTSRPRSGGPRGRAPAKPLGSA